MKFAECTLEEGVITIAFEESEDSITYGVAFCAPQDGFVRDKGRMIAERRLNSGKRVGTIPPTYEGDVVDAIIFDIEAGGYQLSPHRRDPDAQTPLWFFN